MENNLDFDYYEQVLFVGPKQKEALRKSFIEQRDLWIFNETQLRNQLRILSIKNYTLGLTYSERVRYLSTKKKLDTWHLF